MCYWVGTRDLCDLFSKSPAKREGDTNNELAVYTEYDHRNKQGTYTQRELAKPVVANAKF